MRKYVHLAKGIKPQLTKEAADLISEEYTKLRNQDNLETDHMARVNIYLLTHLLNYEIFNIILDFKLDSTSNCPLLGNIDPFSNSTC